MKKIISFIILGMFLISIFGTLISAQLNPPETTIDSPFSLNSWFTHTFGIQPFSVVGDSRRCSSSPDYSTVIQPGQRFAATVSSAYGCSSGYGLWDVFSPNWNPYKEFNNVVDVTCGASGPCNIQLYCCSYPECSSDSDCKSQVGTYSTCKTASCVSWSGGYKCTTDYGTETNIPYCRSSFKYCSQSISKNCYYVDGSSCTKHTYPGVSICPDSYQGATLYSSLSACQNNLCTPSTCSSLGKTCGSVSDGCGGTLNCGTCGSGTSCNSNNYCQSTNVTSPLCGTASIDIIDIPCSINTLNSCNTECPAGYIAGTIDSCGFHSCVIAGTPTPEKTTFLGNSTAFKVGDFNVSWLYLVIGIFLLIILMGLIPRK